MSCEETGGGWIFDCQPLGPDSAAVRLDPLGQRAHEACAVDAVGKVVYTTEDDGNSRFYRWVPNEWTGATPNWAAGGQLQALAANTTAARTAPTPATWVNVTNLTTGYRGADSAVFARGEGCWIDGRTVYFVTTSDSTVWAYDGVAGTLEAVYVPGGGGALTNADNVTVHAPSGDLLVAEDSGNLELVLLTSPFDGSPRTSAAFMRFSTVGGSNQSEVAGPAFSPDGTRLYFSSQRGGSTTTVPRPWGGGSGVTYEVTGPFRDLRAPTPVVPEVSMPVLLAATGAAAMGAAAYVHHRRGDVDAAEA
jgi:secreted PhoX family phosphatase